MFLQSVSGYGSCFVISIIINHKNIVMNNIAERIDNLVQYVVDFIRKIQGYIEDIIAFFEEIRDKVEGLIEYIEEKIEAVQGFVGELKHNTEEAAA
jgi:phage-related protein